VKSNKKLHSVNPVPSPLILATAIALIADKSKMLVTENADNTLELPGLVIATDEKALQKLETLIEKLDIADQPQQTLYLNNVRMDEHRQKPVTVIVRIIHVETAEIPTLLDSHFLSLAKLRVLEQASPLVRTVAQWMSDQ
jgi:hypothetical protein